MTVAVLVILLVATIVTNAYVLSQLQEIRRTVFDMQIERVKRDR